MNVGERQAGRNREGLRKEGIQSERNNREHSITQT